MNWLRAFGAVFRSKDRLAPDRLRPQRHHHRRCRGGAVSQAAQHQRRQGADRDGDGRVPRRRDRGVVRRRGLFHADVLRPVRAAHDRPPRRAVSRRRARRLHLLFGRPQRRRQRLHRRRGALSDLFGLGARRGRGRQDLLHRRPDVLARQRRGAGPRLCLAPGSGLRDRPAAGMVQSRARHRRAGRAGRLRRLGVANAARDRPRQLAGAAAERPADAAADRDRHHRSRLLRARDVHAGAERPAHAGSSTSR